MINDHEKKDHKRKQGIFKTILCAKITAYCIPKGTSKENLGIQSALLQYFKDDNGHQTELSSIPWITEKEFLIS